MTDEANDGTPSVCNEQVVRSIKMEIEGPVDAPVDGRPAVPCRRTQTGGADDRRNNPVRVDLADTAGLDEFGKVQAPLAIIREPKTI